MSDPVKKLQDEINRQLRTVVVLDKTYSSEELCDIEGDVSWAIEDAVLETEPDEHGFHPGAFKVVITYDPTEG